MNSPIRTPIRSPMRSPIRGGYTLMEMTLVIVILGLLLGIGGSAYFGQQKRMRYNDNLVQINMAFKTMRNYAVTNKAIYSTSNPNDPIRPKENEGYGILITKSPTGNNAHFLAFGNVGSVNTNHDNDGDIDLPKESFTLSPSTTFFKLEDGDGKSIDKAILLFLPPYGEIQMWKVPTSGDPQDSDKINEIKMSFVFSEKPDAKKDVITINRIKGFPELTREN